ncbi:hypothetical protein CU044_0172 [Streptomyces sp. L-9-10]|uniref:hypothetical protein n=1 Tax=Streptomyces sp. L-9-10 TaxID=1478131 RepID=UPI00101DACDA|nr:hypothetical protein [Streptomyces sp. L-9-10]RYJ31805.1 hypothetical protein CU044_0172 [Streptomyces sp. L-9-10]
MSRRSRLKHNRVKELAAGIVLLCALTGMSATALSTAEDSTDATSQHGHGSVEWNSTGSDWDPPADTR